MFEDSLVESRATALSPTTRWTAFTSLSLQLAIAAAILALPLLHPEALPFHLDAPRVLLLLPPKPPAPTPRADRAVSAASVAAFPASARRLVAPSLLSSRTVAANDDFSLAPVGRDMGNANGLLADIGSGDTGYGPRVVLAPAKPLAAAVHISSGVSQGLLLAPIRPGYPAIAKAAHVAGSVILGATISESGTIENLRVLSGPVLLRNAAIEAIRAARYRPYLLNGQAVSVQTTITVNFTMNG